ncbi:MAG: hypothetical protein KAQ93_01240 [Spirochaetales bacterium]|nr:hypothetical protein [Spirochaetales bacterium]
MRGDNMGMEKSTVDDLRNYLINCIDKEGIIEGKRRFSLQIGLLENALFNDIDEVYSTIYNFSEFVNIEDANLEELPVVDEEGNILISLNAVS